MQVTFLQADDTPLDKGTPIDLLGDGRVLATETVGEGGVVSFDAETAGVTNLAVRLAIPQTTPAENK